MVVRSRLSIRMELISSEVVKQDSRIRRLSARPETLHRLNFRTRGLIVKKMQMNCLFTVIAHRSERLTFAW